MIERAFFYLVAAVLVMSILAADLPRVTPSLMALGILALVARIVWWRTK